MALRMRIRELISEKSRRDGRWISPSEIAKKVGVSHNTIFAYMDNAVWRPDLRTLDKLQDFFGCTIEELFEKVEDAELEAEKKRLRTFG